MKKIVRIILEIIIAIIFLIGMYVYINFLRDSAFVKIKINNQDFLINKDTSETQFDLQTLNTKSDMKLNIQLNNANVEIDGKTIKNNEDVSLGKLNISEDNVIKINIKLFGEEQYKEYKINTLPSTFPKYIAEGKSTTNGDFYMCTYNINYKKQKHYVYIVDNDGKMIFYKQTNDRAFNFKKNEVDGKVRYTYYETVEQTYQGINDAVPCKLIVLDENYNEIKEIKYKTETEEVDTENHDYYYLGDNHYIIGAYTQEEVDDIPGLEGQKVKMWNFRLEEIKDDKILWEFQSIKNKELYSYFSVENLVIGKVKEFLNIMHFNSMEIDELDGNLICSFRNLDAILKISRTTGEIMWILGGKGDQFGLTEEQKFSKQHSISYLSNHEILIYDNGDKNEKTRILKIKINEETKKLESYESYDLGIYAARMGSVQVTDEEKNLYLIAYGSGMVKSAYEELDLETLEPIFTLTTQSNVLYCVNKY